MHTITVQVAAASTILQDTKIVAVKGQSFCFSDCAQVCSISNILPFNMFTKMQSHEKQLNTLDVALIYIIIVSDLYCHILTILCVKCVSEIKLLLLE